MRPILIVMMLSGACSAQPTANVAPRPISATPSTPTDETAVTATSEPATAPAIDASTDELLDKMERVGLEMKTLRAGVTMKSVDAGTGANSQRDGTITLERLPGGDTRARVVFVDRISGKKRFDERTDFLLAGDWVTQRDFKRPDDATGQNKETRRQVRRPGDKTDLLKLGEGPFPLPIGQPRDRVKSQFEVTHLPNEPDHPGLAGIELKPLESNKLSQRFETITVWVDPTDGLPRVIETVDHNQSTINTTTLSDPKINDGVTDGDFKLEPIDPKEWDSTEVPLGSP